MLFKKKQEVLLSSLDVTNIYNKIKVLILLTKILGMNIQQIKGNAV